MSFTVKKFGSAKLKNPILIEGLPGMGNVGKIAVVLIYGTWLISSFLIMRIFFSWFN